MSDYPNSTLCTLAICSILSLVIPFRAVQAGYDLVRCIDSEGKEYFTTPHHPLVRVDRCKLVDLDDLSAQSTNDVSAGLGGSTNAQAEAVAVQEKKVEREFYDFVNKQNNPHILGLLNNVDVVLVVGGCRATSSSNQFAKRLACTVYLRSGEGQYSSTGEMVYMMGLQPLIIDLAVKASDHIACVVGAIMDNEYGSPIPEIFYMGPCKDEIWR